jgi:LuxR family maltose regulon positive regulatory protein
VVAWLSAQPADDVARFVQILALAVRAAAGRPTFGPRLARGDHAERPGRSHVWLAEITQSALDVVLIVDEATGCLPPRATRWPTCFATRRPTCAPSSRRGRLPLRHRRL